LEEKVYITDLQFIYIPDHKVQNQVFHGLKTVLAILRYIDNRVAGTIQQDLEIVQNLMDMKPGRLIFTHEIQFFTNGQVLLGSENQNDDQLYAYLKEGRSILLQSLVLHFNNEDTAEKLKMLAERHSMNDLFSFLPLSAFAVKNILSRFNPGMMFPGIRLEDDVIHISY